MFQWKLLRDFLPPKTVARLRESIVKGVHAREANFLNVPHTIAAVRQTHEDVDPMFRAVAKRVQQINRRKYRKRSQDEAISSATSLYKRPQSNIQFNAGDVNSMTRKIAAQLVRMNPADANIENDPQRLSAINKHQVNVWMTESSLRNEIFGDFGRSIGKECDLGADATSVLFSDRPTLVLPSSRPSALSFSAPSIGIENHDLAKTLWVFCDDSADVKCPVFIMRDSAIFVARAVESRRISLSVLRNDFTPTDSHVSLWLRHFPEMAASGQADVFFPKSGDALLLHPYTICGWGPNLSNASWVGMQFHVVARNAKPDLSLHSWLKEWRSKASDIDFGNERLFPVLT